MSDGKSLPKIVNVASVPKRSPFRYPGGKTWLVPYVRAWLASLKYHPKQFIEPFVGGGIISLTVGFERLADSVTMIELDEDVAAVWQTILGNNASWLSKNILDFEMTTSNVQAELSMPPQSIRQRAFHTILKNRTFHGGILARGAGLLKHGENGKGVKSRWYPKTLSDRILAIWENRNKFTFFQGEGISHLRSNCDQSDAVFFIDPPYTAGGKGKRAGRRLYNYSEIDHNELFDVATTIKGDFLMTYDNDEEVVAMAKARNFEMELVPMKNTHNTKMVELLIGNNLKWARNLLNPPSLF